jgi:AraC family transcriptional regulator, glycine betaine-responsive activator
MDGDREPGRPIRFGFLILPGFSLMALSAASEPLRAANRLAARNLYDWYLISPSGTVVPSSSGFRLQPDGGLDLPVSFDAIVVVASLNVAEYHEAAVFRWLQQQERRGCEIGAVSTASLLLARAGLLRGYRFTIHWETAQDFTEEFPDLKPSRTLFVIDGKRFTCGGGIAGLDMMLALIARQFGSSLASGVAEQFLHTHIRSAEDSQRTDIVGRYGTTVPALVTALTLMENCIEQPIAIKLIAARSGVTERHLERLFINHLQATPARFYMDLRLREAKRLLSETDISLTEVALRCGFTSPSHFGRCFRQAFQQTPRQARRHVSVSGQ